MATLVSMSASTRAKPGVRTKCIFMVCVKSFTPNPSPALRGKRVVQGYEPLLVTGD